MSKTILIVDDSDVVRRVLREFLSRHTAAEAFQEASDGRQAIVLMQASKPDLIILDLSMPGMGGFRAASELKHLAPEVPILLFTMHDARAEEVGVDAVVSKVDGLGPLAERVRQFLSRDAASPVATSN
jgi:two-component system invasion response regulator UvrY